MQSIVRCDWAQTEPNLTYHDVEWGVPVHDDRQLFEMLTLEGAQAGLSWTTILKRREGYRRAFEGFDPSIVASYGLEKQAELMSDPGIIRNRLKVESTVSNARVFLEIQAKHGSFDAYIWDFVGGKQVVNKWQSSSELPATSELSDKMSKELRKIGFRFVGSTICYAFMQATGMVNDHLVTCFRHTQV